MRSASVPMALLLCTALAVVILLPGSSATPLWDPDEGRHASIARVVYEADTLDARIVPHLDGGPYRHKPILFYWLGAAGYALCGVNELGARLPSLLAALMTVLAVAWWASVTLGPSVGLWSGVVLATSVEFAGLGRFANLDMTLTLWIALGLIAAERWATTERSGWLVAAALAAAAGTLTKGLVAPALIGIAAGAALIRLARQARLHVSAVVAALAVFLAATGTWALAATLADPGYLKEFLLEHHLRRYASADAPHAASGLFYLPVLLGGFLPWSALALAMVAWGAGGAMPRIARPCAAWIAAVILFFVFGRGKLATYLLPVFPPLAVLAGSYASALTRDGPRHRGERRALDGGTGLVALALAATPAVVIPIAARTYEGVLLATSRLSLLTLPFAAVLLWTLGTRRHARLPAVLAVSMTCMWIVFATAAAPRIGDVRSAKSLAMEILRAPADTPILSLGVRIPSLQFYTGRPARALNGRRALARIVDAHDLVFVVTTPRHLDTARAAGAEYPWATTGRRVLLASRPRPGTAAIALTPPAARGQMASP